MIAVLAEEFEHVSIEHIFSGQGFGKFIRAMAKFEGVEVKSYDAPTITDLALKKLDDVCVKTLNQFNDWIGAVAGFSLNI